MKCNQAYVLTDDRPSGNVGMRLVARDHIIRYVESRIREDEDIGQRYIMCGVHGGVPTLIEGPKGLMIDLVCAMDKYGTHIRLDEFAMKVPGTVQNTIGTIYEGLDEARSKGLGIEKRRVPVLQGGLEIRAQPNDVNQINM